MKAQLSRRFLTIVLEESKALYTLNDNHFASSEAKANHQITKNNDARHELKPERKLSALAYGVSLKFAA